MRSAALAFFLVFTSIAVSQNNGSEQLGAVSFANSCGSEQAAFNRGVALLHDFWYEEAERQFEHIAAANTSCAMAHWGLAMSLFHQIWNRPSDDTMRQGWSEIEKAQAPPAGTQRERDYIAALAAFYRPGSEGFQPRVDTYSAAMASIHQRYPDDVDAAAFYALSLLANRPPNDDSVSHERQALAILTPLFVRYPDHPGLAHYLIHACDNPELASQGLHAAQRYGVIAPSAAHSSHMPGHIFARLGMWQEDINANLASVAAAQNALIDHPGAIFDQLHAEDFLIYAYLQSGQEARAKEVVDETMASFDKRHRMHDMGHMDMRDMVTYTRVKFPVFYGLETRDWMSVAALEPVPGASPEVLTLTYWAHVIADGHLRKAKQAQSDLAEYQSLIDQIRKSKPYFVDSTGAKIEHDEVVAWAAFAEGEQDKALTHIRSSADLQDKVGQAEVDIPAREMLADMLMECNRPKESLSEYQTALRRSPNRFNGLYNSGRAAEAIGDKQEAAKYYSALMKITGGGQQSTRAEFAHVRAFLAGTQIPSP